MTTFPTAYLSYLVEFHATRDLFECHELLEEYWKEHPGDPLADTWVGLIQLAVALYHERRGNARGALKMFVQAQRRLSVSPLDKLGIDKDSLQKQLATRIAALPSGTTTEFEDMNLTITNAKLMELCLQACLDRGVVWGAPSSGCDVEIIDRHTRRDRSEVVAARLKAYEAKKRERSSLS